MYEHITPMHHSGDDSSITGNYQLLVILPGQLPVITWPQNPLPGNPDAILERDDILYALPVVAKP